MNVEIGTRVERGKRYDVTVGIEGERPHYLYRNGLFRGRTRYRDVEYWVFEVEFAFYLIDPDDVLEISEVQRRFSL